MSEMTPQIWGKQAKEIVINKINWPLIAIGAIGVLAIANLALYFRNKRS